MVSSPVSQNPPVSGGGQMVPFRRATIRRTNMLRTEQIAALVAGRQNIEFDIPGSGYITSIMLEITATALLNVANVVFTEDAPYNLFDILALRDVNAELFNLGGFNCYISNLVNAQYKQGWMNDAVDYLVPGSPALDSDMFSLVPGVGAGAGGSFKFWLEMPIATNIRDYIGLQGNQDRNQRYFLRGDVAGSAAVYTTPPTTLPAVQIRRYYENLAVPVPRDSAGNAQQVFPSHFGSEHFSIATLSENPPAPGPVGHYLKRLGNSIRWIALIGRMNGSRANFHAAANRPTNIQFKIGDNVVYDESYEYRRMVMWRRFGIAFPPGVLVYDNISDFLPFAGNEIQNDYYHTKFVNNAQFQISYPTGIGATNNSMTILTDDMLLVSPRG